MYYSCHCIKRNGLQHDCRRTGCGGEPTCVALPDPLCAPSQLARARGLADPAPLAAHMRAQGGGAGGSAESSSGGGKRFIVCELKGISQDISSDKGGKCCKCPTSLSVPTQGSSNKPPCVCPTGLASKQIKENLDKCSCKCSSGRSDDKTSMFVFDEKMINKILSSFESKQLVDKNDDVVIGPGGRPRKVSKNVKQEEPCTRPGCVHWQPPPPCVWDAPCKADCFETPPGIQPGRNPLTGGGSRGSPSSGSGPGGASSKAGPREVMKLLTPECCTGCSAPGGASGAAAGGGPAAGLPVLVMKLC